MKREPKKVGGGGGGGGKEGRLVSFLPSPPPPRTFTRAIFRAAFDSRPSFFAPKPHGNACYAGYECHKMRFDKQRMLNTFLELTEEGTNQQII